MEYIYTENAPKPVGPYSQAVKVNNMLFISGQIPINPETGEIIYNDIEKATELTLKNLLNIAEAGGYKLTDFVKLTIYLKDINNFQLVNKVYEKFFSNHKPARVVVEVSNLPKNVDIEIDAICC